MATLPLSHHYIVILCGGSGPRLWPLSTANHPKQFLNIIKPESLIQQTIKRYSSFISPKNIFIVSHQNYKNKLKNLWQIPTKNLIFEPERKNTTMAITLACSHIFRLDPEAIITTSPADHYIQNLQHFATDSLLAIELAQSSGSIITIGIKPAFANPSFGYIKTTGTVKPYPVSRFIEKPKESKAKRLIQNSHWYWNSGIYTFTLKTLQHSLSVHAPKYYQYFNQLSKSISLSLVKKIYHQSPKLPFDKTISEKSHNLKLIPATFDWSDVGEWQAIYKLLKHDQDQNALFNSSTKAISINSQNCLIAGQSDKLIGLVGVSDLAIIDTPQGLLICQLPLSAQVRDLVAKIVADPETKHFFANK